MVSMRIGQTTSAPSSVSFFEMPVQLRLNGASRDTLITLQHNSNNQLFEFLMPFDVLDVEFDPNNWLLQGGANILVGVKSSVQNNSVRLYPNPAKDKLFVSYKTQETVNQIFVRDIVGRLAKHITANDLQNEISFSIADLPSGVYVAEIHTANGSVMSQKIIKE
jgi:hypothetical protein